MRLAGKRCLVTGAAHGIGLATAQMFAREGGAVLMCDINAERGETAARDLQKVGARVRFVCADVSRAADVEDAVAACVAAFGGLDVLVNNAGISRNLPIEKITDEDIDRVYGLNVKGTLYGIRAAVPHMRAAGGGSIVSISSVHALRGEGRNTLYDGSKVAILGMTRALAMELAPDRIRVNAICPGSIDCYPIEERLVPPELREPFRQRFAEEYTRAREALQPYPRRAVPQDIAYGALYLASDESAFVTGTHLVIDGLMTNQMADTGPAERRLHEIYQQTVAWLKEREDG
ncbi:MAG: SDR family oxidoreductase [Armatimonadetes bacterium]|nr:SDR family oxidoreductase [Armatimonadota bacterium]